MELKLPEFDLFGKPLYTVEDIQKFLPHRPPFLFVDKILAMSDEDIVGVKNVTMNEYFFQGHFPGEPIMPGVIQIEAMAQVGGVFILSRMLDPENYTPFFLKIMDVKFRYKVVPGDTLIFYLKLASPVRRGIVHMYSNAYVAGRLVTEGEMMAQLVRKPGK
jgi:UDP-3-O-[3-hydroxymyristoyl] N-acetylglucosamine deacetylase/3-hydroxyacyl-[acyl-carrier-protein] dehydratase